MKKLVVNRVRSSIALLMIAPLAIPVLVMAQEDTLEEEEVFQLSPFTVSAGEDIGYMATNTLAGTRLKTSLEDVASTVTVVTKEFMEEACSPTRSEPKWPVRRVTSVIRSLHP